MHLALWSDVRYKPKAIQSVAAARALGSSDYSFVCSEVFPGTAEMIKDAVSPGTAIVIARDGIRIEEKYSHLYPNHAIVSGVVWIPTIQISPGVIEMDPFERGFQGRVLIEDREPSMLIDARYWRPVEVEAILRNTMRIARKHGVDVTCLEMLYTLTQAMKFALTKPAGRWKENDNAT